MPCPPRDPSVTTPRRVSVTPNQRRLALRRCLRQRRREARHKLAHRGSGGKIRKTKPERHRCDTSLIRKNPRITPHISLSKPRLPNDINRRMPHTYAQNTVHIIFSTKDRRKSIPKEFQSALWAYIAGICKNHGIFTQAI